MSLKPDAFVQALNEHQCKVCAGVPGHPYTCGRRDEPGHERAGGDTGLLIATKDGWRCPYCDYDQPYDEFEQVIVNEATRPRDESHPFFKFMGEILGDLSKHIGAHIREFSDYLGPAWKAA